MSDSFEDFHLKFDTSHRRFLAVLAGLFFLLTSIGLHGYSLPQWHKHIDNSPFNEIILGQPRDIRSDDYMVQLPLVFAQVKHNPPFPVVNTNVGEGSFMLDFGTLPVYNIVSLFRPSIWGYFFLDLDRGLAWSWWFHIFATTYFVFLMAMVLTRNNFKLSLAAGILCIFSPYQQMWALNCADLISFFSLCIVGGALTLFAEKKSQIVAGGVLLGWAGTGFVLFLYPPAQVMLGYLFLFLMAALIAQYRTRFLKLAKLRACMLLTAAALAGIVTLHFIKESKETIQLIVNTVYPGLRASYGDDKHLADFFVNYFVPWLSKIDFHLLGNICEASSYFFVSPIVFLMLIQKFQKRNLFEFSVPIALLLYQVLGLFWVLFGFPHVVADLTLLNKVPGNRAVFALGIADILLFVTALSLPKYRNKGSQVIAAAGLLIWILALNFNYHHWRHILGMSAKNGVAFLLVMVIVAALILFQKHAAAFLLAIASVAVTTRFNPLVRGGTAFLYDNAISKKMIEVQREGGNPKMRWAVFGSQALGNLPRILGLPSIGGIEFYPNFSLWKAFDPEGRFRDTYNRYANVVFEALPVSDQKDLSNPGPDTLLIRVSPCNAAFAADNVGYFLVDGVSKPFDECANLERVYIKDNYQIYRRRG